jgi:hypothetical protein
MILVAGGDSFIFGTELSDQHMGIHSKQTYPAILAGIAGMHYECVAKPGAANAEIARHVINYCETYKDIDKVVLVQWTFANRYEFNFADSGWQSVNVWNLQDASQIKTQLKNFSQKVVTDQINTNTKLQLTGNYDFLKEFYKTVACSEYWETYTSLKEIVMLQNYLKLNNIPYLFTFADNASLYNYTIDKADTSIRSLHHQIDFDKFFVFLGDPQLDGKKEKGFYQWAMENKYPVGATHPLEAAHSAAALLIKDKFNEMVEKHS